jgi:YesN/AraC family two-component response regulator
MNDLYTDISIKTTGFTMTSHFHSDYEIYYLVKGHVRYIIADRIFNLSAGDVALIPSGVIHNTSYGDELTERLLINFQGSLIKNAELLHVFSNGVIRLSESKRFEFESLFKKICDEEERSDAYSHDLIISHLCEILTYINRSAERRVTPKLDGYSKIMQDAVEYINKNYQSDITLDCIAKKCSLSRSFFSKKFKEVTGFGFSEYLTLVRIKNAERLLAEGKKSVTDIAFECGFNDSSYFALKFKELIGTTPKKYQKGN